jgi:hypothetical protein
MHVPWEICTSAYTWEQVEVPVAKMHRCTMIIMKQNIAYKKSYKCEQEGNNAHE